MNAGVSTTPCASASDPRRAAPSGLIDQVSDIAIAAICAEAVGAMAALHELTLDYLKTRKQFGVTIGSFQVSEA